MKRLLTWITFFSFSLTLALPPDAWSGPAVTLKHTSSVIPAVLQFKKHKDNPSQTPIGTPVSLVFIAGALLFLPSILNVTSYTVFGSEGGSVSGPTGVIYTS